MVARGANICKTGRWVTFGITATESAMGYGRMQVADTNNQFADVKSFTEKTDMSTATAYLKSGNYFWKVGNFMVKASTCLESFEAHAPELVVAATHCWDAREQRID